MATSSGQPQRQLISCDRCQRNFLGLQAISQHLRQSARHNICFRCGTDYLNPGFMETCPCPLSDEESDGDLEVDYRSAPSLGMSGTGRYTYSDDDSWGHTELDSASLGASESGHSGSGLLLSGLGEGDWTSSSQFSEGSISLEIEDASQEGDPTLVTPAQARAAMPYCARCDREFRTANGLDCHLRMSRLHPWYCRVCRRDFDREADLVAHRNQVHGDSQNISPATQTTPTVSRIRPTTRQSARSPPSNQLSEDSSMTTIIGPSSPVRNREPTTLVNISCPLCLEHVSDLTSTLCGHCFCKPCITAAITNKPECPVCRAFTRLQSLHPIYINFS